MRNPLNRLKAVHIKTYLNARKSLPALCATPAYLAGSLSIASPPQGAFSSKVMVVVRERNATGHFESTLRVRLLLTKTFSV